MSKYIDAEEAYKVITEVYPLLQKGLLKQVIGSIPTADVVEVVRCRECRWGRKVCGNIECSVDLNAPTEYHGYDWFCPNGEKMDEVGDNYCTEENCEIFQQDLNCERCNK